MGYDYKMILQELEKTEGIIDYDDSDSYKSGSHMQGNYSDNHDIVHNINDHISIMF